MRWKIVAPRRGAWIETAKGNVKPISRVVAPRRGAWIETLLPVSVSLAAPKSHPAGVRGLKRCHADAQEFGQESHPAGVRGLKRMAEAVDGMKVSVAPRRGAWIETKQEQL